ncbi:transmembrane protein [gamma proteobacterium NOR5-3]|nr:transmembrane protein [gamma proteobacterium NOR5-3]
MLGQVALADVADDEINFLIGSIESSGCVFVRNGEEHSAKDAADHLRLKYRRGRRYATSAEHFIDRLASKSSWSGKPYFINCPDSKSLRSEDWLTQRLENHRASHIP